MIFQPDCQNFKIIFSLTNDLPLLFHEGDFIIATPQNVIAIIEVKSKVFKSKFGEIVEKANANGKIICSKTERGLFNGIFAYETGTAEIDKYARKLEELDYSQIIGNPTHQRRSNPEGHFCVNHIVLGSRFFVKYWPTGYVEPVSDDCPIKSPYYGFYDMYDELAIAYFVSNLQEYVLGATLSIVDQENYNLDELKKFFYPIAEGKEVRLKCKAKMAKELPD